MQIENIEGLTCFSFEIPVASSPLSSELNYLILESDPTPDYYAIGNFPPNKKRLLDRHLYLPIKKDMSCFQDVIYRKAIEITQKLGSELSIYAGQMTMQNQYHQCVRLNTRSTDHLPYIIEELKKLGIEFYSNKKLAVYTSFIYYKRYVEYKNLEEGVYQDENNTNRYYFKIQPQIEYKQLKEGMDMIKTNCDFHLFDSFLVNLFYKNEIVDFIGIYSEHCDKGRFGELKQEITKYFQ
ncbi:MAG: hypothetical protein ABFS05_05045 [Bacteroidota bacterium]